MVAAGRWLGSCRRCRCGVLAALRSRPTAGATAQAATCRFRRLIDRRRRRSAFRSRCPTRRPPSKVAGGRLFDATLRRRETQIAQQLAARRRVTQMPWCSALIACGRPRPATCPCAPTAKQSVQRAAKSSLPATRGNTASSASSVAGEEERAMLRPRRRRPGLMFQSRATTTTPEATAVSQLYVFHMVLQKDSSVECAVPATSNYVLFHY